MNTFSGTHVEVPLLEVIDGDTIKVELPGDAIENIRILCLDTEEKPGSGGSKPKTPWGQKAIERAETFFAGAETVTLEFPGTESITHYLSAKVPWKLWSCTCFRVFEWTGLSGDHDS